MRRVFRYHICQWWHINTPWLDRYIRVWMFYEIEVWTVLWENAIGSWLGGGGLRVLVKNHVVKIEGKWSESHLYVVGHCCRAVARWQLAKWQLLGFSAELKELKLTSKRQNMPVNSLWFSDAIWRQGSGSTLAQVMACIKPLPEPMLTDHQWSPVTFIFGQFHKRCLNHHSLKSVWKLHI